MWRKRQIVNAIDKSQGRAICRTVVDSKSNITVIQILIFTIYFVVATKDRKPIYSF